MTKKKSETEERYEVVKKVEGAHPYEVLQPVNFLKKKVGSGTGFKEDVIKKAEMAVKELGSNYINDFIYDAKALKEAFEKFAAAKSASERAKHLKQTSWYAHEIKGQGGSFGYPFISNVSKSLCDYMFELEKRSLFDPLGLEIMRAHISTLIVIGKRRIRGDGGETGMLVTEGLRVAGRKHLTQDPAFLKMDVMNYLKKLQDHMEEDEIKS